MVGIYTVSDRAKVSQILRASEAQDAMYEKYCEVMREIESMM